MQSNRTGKIALKPSNRAKEIALPLRRSRRVAHIGQAEIRMEKEEESTYMGWWGTMRWDHGIILVSFQTSGYHQIPRGLKLKIYQLVRLERRASYLAITCL